MKNTCNILTSYRNFRKKNLLQDYRRRIIKKEKKKKFSFPTKQIIKLSIKKSIKVLLSKSILTIYLPLIASENSCFDEYAI